MNSMYEQGGLLAIDIDEMGVRPSDWNEDIKDYDNAMNDFYGSEKTTDITVYSAEIQIINNGKKLTTDENDSSMQDDEDSNDYDVDPETGEKIFRGSTFSPNIRSSNSVSHDQWIEECLSKFEAPTHQSLPDKTTTVDSTDLFLDEFPSLLFENIDEPNEPDWFLNLLGLDETSDGSSFMNTIISNESVDTNESTSNDITATSSSLSNTTNNETDTKNPSNVFTDDENSNYSQMTFDMTPSVKIEFDADSERPITYRRASIRASNQRQQDEEALRQYNIPLSLNDITHSTTDEYNRHVARLTSLSPEQLHIIKDIRRRGKNKVAAQNCRKRKANSVETLSDEVEELKRIKRELEERKRAILAQITETRHQYEYLHQQVLPDRQLPPTIIVK